MNYDDDQYEKAKAQREQLRGPMPELKTIEHMSEQDSTPRPKPAMTLQEAFETMRTRLAPRPFSVQESWHGWDAEWNTCLRYRTYIAEMGKDRTGQQWESNELAEAVKAALDAWTCYQAEQVQKLDAELAFEEARRNSGDVMPIVPVVDDIAGPQVEGLTQLMASLGADFERDSLEEEKYDAMMEAKWDAEWDARHGGAL